jgi:hypothetical protein
LKSASYKELESISADLSAFPNVEFFRVEVTCRKRHLPTQMLRYYPIKRWHVDCLVTGWRSLAGSNWAAKSQ